jgi:hypothetical protein
MKVILTKPPIPVLWLDTWFILELAAALLSNDDKRKKHADDIVEKIITLTQEKKVLCPKGDQNIEIEVSNNTKIVEKAREIQARMSLGISLNFYAAVENTQVQRMMKAVIEGKREIEFSYKDIFADDPIRTIDRKERFIIDVVIPQTQEQIDQQIEIHKSIAEDWEKLRLDAHATKRTYDKTLELEFQGKADAIKHLIDRLALKQIQGVSISQDEYGQAVDVAGGPIGWWSHYSGEENSLNSVLNFYRSSKYAQIPFVNVGTRLLAELVTGNETVNPSDVMDIHHLSTVLPYATYMVVDKRMRNRIEGKTNLEKEYPGVIIKWQEVLPLLESLEKS